MTCPNCGAELDRHTFGYVCQYCGFISAHNAINELSTNSKLEKAAKECYEYIERNTSYICSHREFVSIKQNEASYVIQCAKSFHPLDKQYQIIQEVELLWKAIVNKEFIRLFLLAKGKNSINGNIIMSLDGILNIILHETKANPFYDEYIVPYTDFESICNSTVMTFALDENRYDEFRIYSHRFYNFVFDRAKYVYAINQRLLTD